MAKQLIKSYSGLIWISIDGTFVRKSDITSVKDCGGERIEIRTSGGVLYSLNGAGAKAFVKEMAFNE